MAMAVQGRGQHLVAADRGFASGGVAARLAGRLPAAFYHRLIDRIAANFTHGSIDALLPDGTRRTVTGREPGPAAQLVVHQWQALARLALAGSVGWFRGWMAGEWDSDDIVALIAVFSANRRSLGGTGRSVGPLRWLNAVRHALRRNSRDGSLRNIHAHYDLGNDFYAAWLDPGMVYSSAMFTAGDEPLAAAQQRKIDAALDRLNLSPGQRLLEIGCGWGGLGARAIERHGVAYTGLTLSAEQQRIAAARVAGSGRVALRDYRDEAAQYDAIASVEMVEAVGQEFWPDYLDSVARCLKPGGRAAIQYIAIDDRLFDAYAGGADFIQTYIFPGGCLISERRFRALAESRGLRWVDHVNFGPDYAATLRHWHDRYDAAVDEGRIPERFDQAFHQLWRYYFDYCEGGFRGGSIWVAQVTLVKGRE